MNNVNQLEWMKRIQNEVNVLTCSWLHVPIIWFRWAWRRSITIWQSNNRSLAIGQYRTHLILDGYW